jgi:N-acetylmuramoyl-L-alanine amidase
MRKVFISAGHTRKGQDSGAVANGYKEGDLAAALRDKVVSELKTMGVTSIVDDDKNALQQTINAFRAAINPTSILLDIHFNAGGELATGVETFVPDTASGFELELAGELSEVVAEVMTIKLRGNAYGFQGVKTERQSARGKLGWMRLVGENVLLEVCFMTNKKELDTYLFNENKIAKRIAFVLATFAGK